MCPELDEGFEETYPTRDDYVRFHQMNTAFGRAMRAGKRGYGEMKDPRGYWESP